MPMEIVYISNKHLFNFSFELFSLRRIRGDVVLDPFAGSGTTLVVAEQLGRKSIGIELDSQNVALIQNRLAEQRESDDVSRFFKDYAWTLDLETIWREHGLARKVTLSDGTSAEQMTLLESSQ